MTYAYMRKDIIDALVLVDDESRDDTVDKANGHGIHTIIYSDYAV